MVERELEEAVTVPVYGGQAALVRARDKTAFGKRMLLPGATGVLPEQATCVHPCDSSGPRLAVMVQNLCRSCSLLLCA